MLPYCGQLKTTPQESRPICSDSLNLMPPAPLYLRTLWRYTNAVIIKTVVAWRYVWPEYFTLRLFIHSSLQCCRFVQSFSHRRIWWVQYHITPL